jgi:hypothetical protein
MAEEPERPEKEAVDEQVGGQGGEGEPAAEVTPEIGEEDLAEGRTGHSAPAGDVGVPSDEDIAEEEPEARQDQGAPEDEEA